MKSKKIIFLIGIIIFLGIVAVYSMKSPSGGNGGVSQVSETDVSGSANSNNGEADGSDETVKILSALNSISLKTDFFEDEAYLSLEDIPVQLSEGNLGRNNPFAPYSN